MAKYEIDPIGASDLEEFINTKSDFGFEMQVLHTLRELCFTCHHGGTYDDRVTGKPRQYDIHARKEVGTRKSISLAVECKQLKHYFPLLVSRVPRTEDESFVQIIEAHRSATPALARSRVVAQTDWHRIYKPGGLVGKCTEQVGRITTGDLSSGDDSEIYSKWSQAVSSVFDLAQIEAEDGWRETRETNWKSESIICPVVVVPDGTLWVADFDDSGNLVNTPKAVELCDFYLDKSYFLNAPRGLPPLAFRISHMEIATVSGLTTCAELLHG